MAWISSSYVNHDLELLAPDSDCAYMNSLPEPFPARGDGDCGCKNTESGEQKQVTLV